MRGAWAVGRHPFLGRPGSRRAALSFRAYRSLMERTCRQSAQMRGCFAGEMGGGVLPSTLTRNRLCRRKKSSGMSRGDEHFGQRRVERGACFMAATGLKVKGRAWSRAGTRGGAESGRLSFWDGAGRRGEAPRFWAARVAHGGGNAAVLFFGAARGPCEGSSVGAARGSGAVGGGLALRGVAVLRGGVRICRHD